MDFWERLVWFFVGYGVRWFVEAWDRRQDEISFRNEKLNAAEADSEYYRRLAEECIRTQKTPADVSPTRHYESIDDLLGDL
jgi:hypothetical protein